jgi:general nucleoside transport system ATP-binding protein
MTVAASTPGKAAAAALLELRSITKRFPGVVANDGVDFEVQAGEVHTLFGENGAGKSTLMRVLYGFYTPDAGEIRLRGEPVAIASPADAIAHGIGMIHQHFMLVSTLTVAENVALGMRSSRRPLTDLDAVSRQIGELSDRYGLRVDPHAVIWQLSVGERQRVEIIKALYRDVSLLILDEPTAVLTPQEVDDLFAVLRQMVADGRGLVFISHKIREVLELSDRITVLRNGRKVGTVLPSEVTRQGLAEMMVGHELPSHEPPTGNGTGDARLVVRDLTVKGDRGVDAVRGVGFAVRGGEIVGIAGVSGNGQRELAETIAGLRPASGGSIAVEGTELVGRRPGEVRRFGVGYVPEERMRDGVVPAFSVAENLHLIDNATPRFSRWGFLRGRALRRSSDELVAEFGVKTPSLETPARNLSGGNIQKLILARELSARPRVLIAAQPTRGVDVGAAHFVHERLLEQRAAGTAILVVSEDLDEVLSLADRVLVMYEGEIIAEARPRESTREALGLMMAGVREQADRDERSTAPLTAAASRRECT